MNRYVPICLLVVSSLGCNRFAGPIAVRNMDRADAPGYTIAEQEQRGRERLTITEDDYRIGPNGYISRPSPTGR